MKYLVKYTRRHGFPDKHNKKKRYLFNEDGETVFECLTEDYVSRLKWMRRQLLREYKVDLSRKYIDDFYKLTNINVVIYSMKPLGKGEVH